MYFGKYVQVFLSRYVEIDQVVFDKNIYAILTNRFTDVGLCMAVHGTCSACSERCKLAGAGARGSTSRGPEAA
jgi:hypothetical protein